MLTAQPNGIATAQAGVEQDVAPDPLARADRPAFVVCLGIGLRPLKNPGPFLRLGFSTPSVGSMLTCLAFLAHFNGPHA